MDDCISVRLDSQTHIDLETGEITITRKGKRASHKNQATGQQNFTGESVKNYRQDSKKSYGKLHNLGAHAMLNLPVCKLSKTVALMLRDSTYKGISYINPILVSKELGIDVEYARKLLKKIEDNEFAVKIETNTGFYYLINPSYYMAGDGDDEQIARKMWASAMTRREKEKKAK